MKASSGEMAMDLVTESNSARLPECSAELQLRFSLDQLTNMKYLPSLFPSPFKLGMLRLFNFLLLLSSPQIPRKQHKIRQQQPKCQNIRPQ